MSRIVYANFGKGCDICCVNNLYQWENSVMLHISGIEAKGGTKVCFSLDDTKGEAQDTICSSENDMLCTFIPAFILEKPNVQTERYNAYAYIYLDNEDGTRCRKKIVFEIKATPKSNGWAPSNDPSYEEQILESVAVERQKAEDAAIHAVEVVDEANNVVESYKAKEGKPNGIATLDEDGKVLKTQLPEINDSPVKAGSGKNSAIQGQDTDASGANAMAIGRETKAPGGNGFASGRKSEANGNHSAALNYDTKANAQAAMAINRSTIASSENQFVHGKFNIEDTENKYAHIVGNGTSGKQSNAYTLDWEGNGTYTGEVFANGNKKLAKEEMLVCKDISGQVVIKKDTKGIKVLINVSPDDPTMGSRWMQKATDFVPTYESEWIGNFYYIFDIEGNEEKRVNKNVKSFDGGYFIGQAADLKLKNAEIIIIKSDGVTINDITFPKKGIYFLYDTIDMYESVYSLIFNHVTVVDEIKEPLLIADAVKTILSSTLYMTDEEKKAIRDALGITALIEALQ